MAGMFGLRRASREIEDLQSHAALSRAMGGRQAYLQRLGISAAADAEKPALEPPLADGLAPAGVEHAAAQSDVRQKFLRKLAYSKVWVPQAHRAPKHRAVVIFDWDDTLLCTSWLLEHDYPEDSHDECLQKIVQLSKSLLETAIATSDTYIITNAMSGWVEYSAARWAPELLPVLRKVRVISARDRFEAAFPDDVRQWKINAFLEVQRQMNAVPITNLVALGDADYEIEAARIMGDECEEGIVKTVKFQPCPSPEEHLKQLEIVDKLLLKIVGSVRKLKVSLEQRS